MPSIIGGGGQTQLLRLKYKLLKYKKVSFDIFDTLIKRDVEDNKDVFYLLAKEYIKKYGSDTRSIQDVIQLRLLAQRIAESNKMKEEISISDIYSNSEFKKNERVFLLAKEQELEYQLAQRNLLIGRLYDWCIQCKKEVILASDMYLPMNIINNILEKNNYTQHKKVYLSSHSGKRKSTGNLFDEILESEQCTGKEMIHIGDAKKGDFLRPIQKGINSILISRNRNVCLNKRRKTCLTHEYNIFHRTLHQFVNNRIGTFEDITSKIGYELMGPILYGYCGWLHNKSKEHNIRHIYFLAREGVFLHHAYLKMFPEDRDMCSVLRVSRYAIKKAFEKPDGNQMMLLKHYLAQEKFIGNPDDNRAIAVADVGWQGTMQRALSLLCEKSIFGFYIGFKKNKDFTNAYGYLFQGERNKKTQDEIMFTATFFENCFMVSEGTTLEYSMQNKYVVPILEECEQPNDVLHMVKAIQYGMICFIEDSLCSGILKEIIKMPVLTEIGYAYYMSHIKNSMLIKIGSMVSKDDERVNRITAQNKFMFYVIHPKKLISEFQLNKSKLLFLKSICGLPIPYMKLLSALKRLEEQRGSNQ